MNDPTVADRPTAAGMYDFYLGGTAHNRADRAAAEQVTRVLPEATDTALANRGFLQRAVKRMATEYGIRQYLDIGAGLPTERNTHDVLAESIPDGRVVYVDVDPAAVARAEAMLAGVPGTVAVPGDVRDPDGILQHPLTRRLLDLTEPVGLLLVAVLHYVPDDDDPWGLIARYVDTIPPGSGVAISHISVDDQIPERVREAVNRVYAATPTPPVDRSRTEIERFFKGLEIVTPYQGATPTLTTVGLWGAEDPDIADSDGSRMSLAALGYKR